MKDVTARWRGESLAVRAFFILPQSWPVFIVESRRVQPTIPSGQSTSGQSDGQTVWNDRGLGRRRDSVERCHHCLD